jgi:hypothetical protein
MARQFRGVSRLVFAPIIETSEGTTYGTPVAIVGVKAISREIAADSEQVWADNKLQDETFAGTTVTRNFETMRLDPAIEAQLLGATQVQVKAAGTGTPAVYAYATPADASNRPYFAFGYALHDGNVEKPCEIVWAYRGKVRSISKSANTIDAGTGSEGQSIEVAFAAPIKKFTATGESNLDLDLPVTADTDVDAWFSQVVTPDNVASIMS